ncbi:hypothetical protein [Gilvimarinus agarilyticus]|uniref:hypothetical protein n=1 Tax=Gilvimarinus agarilyticus TaxID=679259 RepID=UPI00059F2CE8|nr:hypothetical protein [Gilvimarinus agarilyticus]
MMSLLAYKRPMIEIDGNVYPRGESFNITAAAEFSGAFVAEVFVRGAGQGHGGNINKSGVLTGQYGSNASSSGPTVRSFVGDIAITIGYRGTNGTDRTYVGVSIVAPDGTNGGSTLVITDAFTQAAGNANNAGEGAVWNESSGTSESYNPYIASPTNPLGGSYGRGGYQLSIGGGSYQSFNASNGVVQITKVID